jgi:hypothetical protein
MIQKEAVKLFEIYVVIWVTLHYSEIVVAMVRKTVKQFNILI